MEMALWSLLGPRAVDVLAFESFGEGWATDVVKQLRLPDVRVSWGQTVHDLPHGRMNAGEAAERGGTGLAERAAGPHRNRTIAATSSGLPRAPVMVLWVR